MSSTIWFTGLTSSGKTTISKIVVNMLKEKGYLVCHLDSDNLRNIIGSRLGFSKEDRFENIRRLSYICKLMNDAGVIAVAAAISPYRESRKAAAQIIGKERFFEVYLNCPLNICKIRDSKDIYYKYENGEIRNVAGLDDPYEPPVNPSIMIQTNLCSPEHAARSIFEKVYGA